MLCVLTPQRSMILVLRGRRLPERIVVDHDLLARGDVAARVPGECNVRSIGRPRMVQVPSHRHLAEVLRTQERLTAVHAVRGEHRRYLLARQQTHTVLVVRLVTQQS